MICKRHKIFYGLLPLFLFFFSFFFLVNDSYAVDDISVTYTSVPSAYDNVFPTCSGDCLNDYSYLIVQITQPVYNNLSYFRLETRFDGSTSKVLVFSSSTSFAIYQLPFNGSSNNYLQFMSNYNSQLFSSGITFTLSENYQSGITPSGSIELTENGTYDVTNYAEAVVNVPESSGGGSGGNYHEDLVNIYHAIMICGAIVLVLYFFYCIYRVIIKSTGGK